jgi:hypothetical protein
MRITKPHRLDISGDIWHPSLEICITWHKTDLQECRQILPFFSSGVGRASARKTIGRVVAGAVAEKFLSHYGIEIVAFTSSVGLIFLSPNKDAFELPNEPVVPAVVG